MHSCLSGWKKSFIWQKEGAPYIDVELLTPNEYSRPQIPIESVQYIAIHYTANPGATAIANRNYFENLATTHDTKVSSHFVVGLDGEVVQCIWLSLIFSIFMLSHPILNNIELSGSFIIACENPLKVFLIMKI